MTISSCHVIEQLKFSNYLGNLPAKYFCWTISDLKSLSVKNQCLAAPHQTCYLGNKNDNSLRQFVWQICKWHLNKETK